MSHCTRAGRRSPLSGMLPEMHLETLGLLERGKPRKAAIDCGLDIVQE